MRTASSSRGCCIKSLRTDTYIPAGREFCLIITLGVEKN
ncbi:unnamed protein product [Brassica napus]|uniref:(rape) hypothetical protein n=1 Tax=Brassica napus TaxID=3708 RepID=A0A816VVB1_BRANA|nr:unnamed protein product [Brassica napus]